MTAYESVNKPYPPKQSRDGYRYPSFRIRITIFPNRAPPHFSCKATQVTATVDFPALECTPNPIDHFFSVAFNVPAITPLPAYPTSPQTPRRPRKILPTIYFCGRLHYRAAAFHRSVRWIGSDPSQDGNSGATPALRTIFPLRNLESLSVCLEMCSLLICFQLFPSWAVSPRQSYLFHVILLLFYCLCCLTAAADPVSSLSSSR